MGSIIETINGIPAEAIINNLIRYIPDYVVTPSLNDLLNDVDYTLQYTLKLIRENKLKK